MAELVEGFLFEDEDLANEARKEAEGIRYVNSRMDYEKPAQVLNVYQKMIKNRMFQTEVGFTYLKQIQDYLRNSPEVDKVEILAIPITGSIEVKETADRSKKIDAKIRQHNKFLFASVVGNFVLLVAILIMMLIAASANSTTILNYENKLIDKYTYWQTELEEKEAQINARGKELDEKEAQINARERELQEMEAE